MVVRTFADVFPHVVLLPGLSADLTVGTHLLGSLDPIALDLQRSKPRSQLRVAATSGLRLVALCRAGAVPATVAAAARRRPRCSPTTGRTSSSGCCVDCAAGLAKGRSGARPARAARRERPHHQPRGSPFSCAASTVKTSSRTRAPAPRSVRRRGRAPSSSSTRWRPRTRWIRISGSPCRKLIVQASGHADQREVLARDRIRRSRARSPSPRQHDPDQVIATQRAGSRSPAASRGAAGGIGRPRARP
jgi:hypothetical protein